MTEPSLLPRPQTHNAHELSRASGLGCSPFARRYSGNRICFLFLGVLRWFTSPRSLRIPYLIQGWIARVCLAGLPHSEIFGSKPACGSPKLIAAYRVLHRPRAPRHPPYALSSLTIKMVFSRPAPLRLYRINCQRAANPGWDPASLPEAIAMQHLTVIRWRIPGSNR